MARGLIIEEQGEKFIEGDDLPHARGGYAVPDYSGAGKSIFASMINRDEKGDNLKAKIQADKDLANLRVGIGPDGNYTRFQLPNGSPEYQAHYYNGATSAYRGQFSLDLNNALNEIQGDVNIPAEQKPARMQARLEGFLKAAPEEFRADWTEVGQRELTQRAGLIAAQEAEKHKKLLVGNLEAQLDASEQAAWNAEMAGIDSANHKKDAHEKIDRLVEMGELAKEVGQARKDLIDAAGYGFSLRKRVLDDMLAGRNSPEGLLAFAAKLKNGGDATINVTEIKPDRRSLYGGELSIRENVVSVRDVMKKIPDEKLRGKFAEAIETVAHTFRSSVAEEAKKVELDTWLKKFGTDAYMPMPAHLRDEFSEAVTSLMTSGAMDNDEGRSRIASLVVQSKYIPDGVLQRLKLEMNGADEKFKKAAEFIHFLRTAKSADGGDVGNKVIESLPEDFRHMFSAVELGLEYGHKLPEIRQAIKNAASGPNRVGVEDAIAAYNGTTSDKTDKFGGKIKNKFLENTGLSVLPPEAKSEMERLYLLNYVASGDANASVDKAIAEVSRAYVKNEIFLKGYAKTHQLELTNPPGFDTGKFLSSFRNTGYEWLNKQVVEDVLAAGANLGDSIDSIAGEPLGKNLFLVPTDTRLDRPQFEVWLKTKNGDIQPVQQKSSSGLRPLIIDPSVEREAIVHKHTVLESADLLRQGVEGEVERMRQRAQSIDGPLGFPVPKTILRRATDADTLKKLQVDEDKIRAAAQEHIRQMELKSGVDIPEEKVNTKTFLQPQAAGPAVVKEVVKFIDNILPDGTGGAFLARVAAQESDFGRVKGTFRTSGDRGIFQINEGSAFVEIHRLLDMGKGKVYEAAELIKQKTGIDLSKTTYQDLDKPLISGLYARLYFLRRAGDIPKDLIGQAQLWKDYYNTYKGAGHPSEFIKNASKLSEAGLFLEKGDRTDKANRFEPNQLYAVFEKFKKDGTANRLVDLMDHIRSAVPPSKNVINEGSKWSFLNKQMDEWTIGEMLQWVNKGGYDAEDWAYAGAVGDAERRTRDYVKADTPLSNSVDDFVARQRKKK